MTKQKKKRLKHATMMAGEAYKLCQRNNNDRVFKLIGDFWTKRAVDCKGARRTA